jgi:hypothetical protein
MNEVKKVDFSKQKKENREVLMSKIVIEFLFQTIFIV